MKNDEIRAANRKALPKFLLFTLVCAVIGGIAGYCAARYGLDQLSGVVANASAFFGARIAPWLMVAVAVITPAVCIPMYRHAKALLASWDGEDEDTSSVIDGKLSAVLWASSASLVLAFFLIAATYSVGFASFDSWESTFHLHWHCGVPCHSGGIHPDSAKVRGCRQADESRKESVHLRYAVPEKVG